jgi:predicted AAA+ superfamily ATPase
LNFEQKYIKNTLIFDQKIGIFMKRLINYDLTRWRMQKGRKPLIIRGARQVGKTHAVRELGKQFQFFLEINFEKNPEMGAVFEKDLDPKRIMNALIATTGISIAPGKTLLFFDEVQLCPKGITALRYFYEEMPELHVVAAGSLLDFAIEQVGVPVGRVTFCYMYPLSFMEFLAATSQIQLLKCILAQSVSKPIDDIIHRKIIDVLGEYILLGGMPGVIAKWIENKDLSQCVALQHDIINAYRQDFPKYARKLQIKYVDLIFNEIPQMISEPFKFSKISGDYKKRELEPALDLLVKAGVVHQVFFSSGNGFPLGASMDFNKYKLLFLDVGLTQAMLGLGVQEWLLNASKTFVNKGALTEALVGQELLCYASDHNKSHLYYWHRETRGSMAEIDYLIRLGNTIIPVEVKSKTGSHLRRMHLFLKEHETHSPYGLRFSTHNYSVYEKLHSYPIYAVAGLLAEQDKNLKDRLLSLSD